MKGEVMVGEEQQVAEGREQEADAEALRERAPEWFDAGECEWSSECDYRSYAAEELRVLRRGRD
jgi:hypothetical protein